MNDRSLAAKSAPLFRHSPFRPLFTARTAANTAT
jgi:hypothetical protein